MAMPSKSMFRVLLLLLVLVAFLAVSGHPPVTAAAPRRYRPLPGYVPATL